MHTLTLRRLSWIFLRVANLTFGGGDPTMAALNVELVKQRKWLSAEDYGLVYALARITPGTNILAFCAGIGWRLLGWPAAILGVLGMTLPSAVIALLLAQSFEALRSHAARMALAGVLAATVGMMCSGTFELIRPHLKKGRLLRAVVVLSLSLLLSLGFSLSPVPILGIAALLGLVWGAPEP